MNRRFLQLFWCLSLSLAFPLPSPFPFRPAGQPAGHACAVRRQLCAVRRALCAAEWNGVASRGARPLPGARRRALVHPLPPIRVSAGRAPAGRAGSPRAGAIPFPPPVLGRRIRDLPEAAPLSYLLARPVGPPVRSPPRRSSRVTARARSSLPSAGGAAPRGASSAPVAHGQRRDPPASRGRAEPITTGEGINRATDARLSPSPARSGA